MNKNWKKVVAAALAAGMAFSGMGCGDSKDAEKVVLDDAAWESDNPVSDEPVTFTMMYSGEFNPEYKSLQKMTELTNVTLDVTAIPDSDYDTRNQLVINTGEDMPDMICKTSPTPAQALSGVLLPISDYFDKMPNYMKFIEDHDLQYLIDDATQTDGKVYELPINTKEVKEPSKQIFVRKDIFEKNNIPIPTTYDELYDAASQLKQIYPDSAPIQVIYGNGNLLDMMAPSFGTTAGWGKGIDGFHYDEESDQWIFAPATDEYRTMLEYLNKLYSEGLLNQEYTTFSNDMYAQNASDGTAFVLMAEWLGCEVQYNEALKEAGETDADWEPIYPLEGPAGAYVSRVSNSTQTMVLSADVAKKDYFPQLIKWIDWMYSDEGADLFSWGIEGESYTVDANGNKVLADDIKCAANPDGTVDMQKVYGASNNNLTFVYPDDFEQATSNPSYLELAKEENDGNAVPNIEPTIALTEEDADTQALYATNLNDYVDQMTTKFIMGAESFDNWDNYVKECNDKGAAQLLELYSNAWKNMEKN